ncbi:hypothetical protein TRFO_08737 [Tritrichomonas foetus]|uniref:USP domain-containing protein n=1 Tax=Tritrichomonas foetus TaxID=1144522 RepID=A0A1J4JN98_9EUKA|nr:hypothetical protein TRFO_08737 [Tritrichomonas foetus]|eukprot:OHS98732.1 hypothetical protein TRFO_08737 [Tritrichomonas foetus]
MDPNESNHSIDFDNTLIPLTNIQIQIICSDFYKMPDYYSSSLFFLFNKRGPGILNSKGWEIILSMIIAYLNDNIDDFIPSIYEFLSATIPNAINRAGSIISVLYDLNEVLLSQYIDRYFFFDENQLDTIFSSFMKIFRSIPIHKRELVISNIFEHTNLILNEKYEFVDKNILLGTLEFVYKFIYNYESIIDFSSHKIHRHKKIKFDHSVKVFDFSHHENEIEVFKTTLFSDIALRIGFESHINAESVILMNQERVIYPPNYALSNYNLSSDLVIYAATQNSPQDSYFDYKKFFLTELFYHEFQLIENILDFVRGEIPENPSMNDSNKLNVQIQEISWKLLNILPNSSKLLNLFSNPKSIIELMQNETNEKVMQYLLTIFYNKHIKRQNNYKYNEVLSYLQKKLVDKFYPDNLKGKICNIFNYMYTYFNRPNSTSESIIPLAKLVVNSKNVKTSEKALSLLTILVSKFEDNEKYLILQLKEALKEILRESPCNVLPFFNSFRHKYDVYNIVQECIEKRNSPKTIQRLIDVQSYLITNNNDPRKMIHYIESNFDSITNSQTNFDSFPSVSSNSILNSNLKESCGLDVPITELYVCFVHFLNKVFGLFPDFCLEKVYLLKKLYKTMINISHEPYTKECFTMFNLFRENNKQSINQIINKLRCAIEIDCNRWGYSPENFKRNSNGLCGLRNLGSTCYMNSIIQQLYYNSDFCEATFHSNSDNKFIAELRNIFINLALSNQASVNTEFFADRWKEDDPYFSPRIQEDAEEFLHRLFNKLPMESIKTFRGKQTGIFQGINVTFNKEVKENIYFFPISVKGYHCFEDSMPLFLVPQMFTESNQYKDDVLGSIDVKYDIEINELPKTLVVLLKRFDFDKQTQSRRKITNEFSFPLEFEAAKYFPGKNEKYALKGVITHSGTAEGGHYNSLIRRTNNHIFRDQWIDFDDTNATNITDDEFYSLVKGKDNVENARCAYLLFYESSNHEQRPINLINEYLTPEEKEKIAKENHEFNTFQMIFSTYTANFVAMSDDMEFLFTYFINIFCHSSMTDLIPSFEHKIISFINNENPELIAKMVSNMSQKILDIIKSSTEEFEQTISKILNLLIQKVNCDLVFHFVDYLINSIDEMIQNWKQLSYIMEIIYNFISKDPSIALGNDWGNRILQYIQRFYEEIKGSIPIKNINFSFFFQSIIKIYQTQQKHLQQTNLQQQKLSEKEKFVHHENFLLDINNIKQLINKYGDKINESQFNVESFIDLKDLTFGLKIVKDASSSPEKFCEYISSLYEYEAILQAFDVSKKGKSWILDAFLTNPQKISSVMITFSIQIFLPFLTDSDQKVRDQTEELCHQFFPKIPILENYEKAELITYGKAFVQVYELKFNNTNEIYNDKNFEEEDLQERNDDCDYDDRNNRYYREYNENEEEDNVMELFTKRKKTHRDVSFRNKNAEIALAKELLNSCFDYLKRFIDGSQEEVFLTHILRIVHWLKIRLKCNEFRNLDDLLPVVLKTNTNAKSKNIYKNQNNENNMNLIELLHLYNSYTDEQFSNLFNTKYENLMEMLYTSKSNSDRCGRFIMFIVNIRNSEQFIRTLESQYFFAALTLLHPMHMSNPFYFLCRTFFKILNDLQYDKYIENLNRAKHHNHEEEESENIIQAKQLITKFANFIGENAAYFILAPLTFDEYPIFYYAIEFVSPYMSQKASSKLILDFLQNIRTVEKKESKPYIDLITKISQSRIFSVTKEEVEPIFEQNYSTFLNEVSLHDLLRNCTSSLEFSIVFQNYFEQICDMKKNNENEWRLSSIFMLSLYKHLSDESSNQESKLNFIVNNLINYNDFLNSQWGQECIKIIADILCKGNSDEITMEPIINLFVHLNENKMEITENIREFLLQYIKSLETEDHYDMCEGMTDIIFDVNSPDFVYTVQFLSIVFDCNKEIQESFLENYPIDVETLDSWPTELEKYKAYFIE